MHQKLEGAHDVLRMAHEFHNGTCSQTYAQSYVRTQYTDESTITWRSIITQTQRWTDTADESDWIETAYLLDTIYNTHTQSRWLRTEFQPIGQTGVGVASDVELLNLMARTSGLMSASKRYFIANHLPRNWGGGGTIEWRKLWTVA